MSVCLSLCSPSLEFKTTVRPIFSEVRRDLGYDDRAPRDVPFNDRPPRDLSYNDRPPPRRDEYPRSYGRDSYGERPAPPPRREHEKAPPSQVLGVFGLSVQTRETDLDFEFSKYGEVESVNIVYDQRVSKASFYRARFRVNNTFLRMLLRLNDLVDSGSSA